ncbi:hypothetical protein BD309DRAFT_561492 [Dichomitus squalens]|uniref:DUF6699 domain-containing protein n=1 Tax=Dichomitus squalens TaxID=114155 RepID=A0A4Q9NF06_9APHY|nr:hypothetical protein BD309DRAFT_561492 [Dichomitus squalens]TBU60738.1 hypothetical protein BD310DRAFT_265431 [Dichomitus squalens]
MAGCFPFCGCTNHLPVYPPVHTYRHRGRWPPPQPRPVLQHATYPYVPLYQSTPAQAQPILAEESRRTKERSQSRDLKTRRVHFADQPIVIDLPNHPPRNAPAADATTRPRPRSPSITRAPSPIRPAVNRATPPVRSPARPPAAHATPAPPLRTSAPAAFTPATAARHCDQRSATTPRILHDLLTSFPSGLWDMRRNARPTYHPQHEPRYSEPVYPHDRRKTSIKLYFTPCSRTEFSWITKVRAGSRKHLTVDDVLDAISTELFRRSAVRDLYESHPCFSKIRSARRIRTRRGYTKTPHYDDAFRNVDLYHVDHGQVLYFRGLKPERLRDGEVVYLVKFSYA